MPKIPVITEDDALDGLQDAIDSAGFRDVIVSEYNPSSYSWDMYLNYADPSEKDVDNLIKWLEGNGFEILDHYESNVAQVYDIPEYIVSIEAGVKPLKSMGVKSTDMYNRQSDAKKRMLRRAALKSLNMGSVMKSINSLKKTLMDAKTQAIMVAGELEEMRLSEDIAVNSAFSDDAMKLDYAIQACEGVAAQMDEQLKLTDFAKSAIRGEVKQNSEGVRTLRKVLRQNAPALRKIQRLRRIRKGF